MDEINETQEASQYLKRHVEPPQPEKPINSVLKNPDSKYLEGFLETGKATTPFFTFSGSLSPITANEFVDSVIEKLRKQLKSEGKTSSEASAILFGTSIGLDMRLKSDEKYPIQTVSSFTVEGNNETLNVLSLLPDQYQVVWVPSGNIDKSGLSLENELLIISGDLTSPEGLLVILHEIGHFVDLETDSARKTAVPNIQANMMAKGLGNTTSLDHKLKKAIMSKFNPVTESDIKIFLETERNAWAFALKTISRFTSDRNLIHACMEYIHEQPLRMQADILRSKGFVE